MGKLVRTLLGLFGFALLLGVGAVVFVALRSGARLDRTVEVAAAELVIPSDPAAIERGRHLVYSVVACNACHGQDLGGDMFFDAQPMGLLPAPNLTPGAGGLGADFTPQDWDRAIRHGVGRDGRPLLFMPANAYQHLTDREISDIIAWLQILPGVDRDLTERSLGPVTRLLLATGQPILDAEVVVHEAVGGGSTVPAGLTAPQAVGHHLSRIAGCTDCHGEDLSGGRIAGSDPSWPPAANLTPHADGLGRHDPESFRMTLRAGLKGDGTQIDPKVMPWTSYAGLTDGEIAALWEYLNTREPRETPRS